MLSEEASVHVLSAQLVTLHMGSCRVTSHDTYHLMKWQSFLLHCRKGK